MSSQIERRSVDGEWQYVEVEAQTLLNVRGTLTAAEILTLHSVGVVLRESPGPGMAYSGCFGTLVIIGGATPYAAGGDVCVAAVGLSGDSLVRFGGSQDALQAIGGEKNWVSTGAMNSTDPWASWEDRPLMLTCRTADFTDGNGTLAYSIYYDLVEAP